MDPTKPPGCTTNSDGSLRNADEMSWSDPGDSNHDITTSNLINNSYKNSSLATGGTSPVTMQYTSLVESSATSAHSDLRPPVATSMSLRCRPCTSISHSSLRHPPTPPMPPTYTATCPHPPPSPCHPPLSIAHCRVPHTPAATSLTPQPLCPSHAQHCAPHAHTTTSLTP